MQLAQKKCILLSVPHSATRAAICRSYMCSQTPNDYCFPGLLWALDLWTQMPYTRPHPNWVKTSFFRYTSKIYEQNEAYSKF